MEQCVYTERVYYGKTITEARTIHVQKSNHDSDKRLKNRRKGKLEVREQPCMMMTLSVDERTIHTKEEKLETKIQCETKKERSEERKPESGCIDKFIAQNMFWIGMLCELLSVVM